MNTNPTNAPLDWNKQQNAVTEAFKALRKQGIVARRGVDLMATQAKATKPCVWTEPRDERRWKSEPTFRYGVAHLYISFGPPGDRPAEQPVAEYHASVVAVGEAVARALTEAGAVYEWDRTPYGCIKVLAPA